ncbi:MAG: hypothetical protein AAF571_05050 [Verrucomicrobiota bacterium]
MITGANDLTFSGGAGTQTYAQLGHGGVDANGDHSGAIMLIGVNDLSFVGGGEFSAYAQLGHGGVASAGNHGGAIMITGANDLNFSAGVGTQAYAQLGHGGVAATGNHSGDITIEIVNDLDFSGGNGLFAYTQLGHGDASNNTTGTRQGNITVLAGGEISLEEGTGSDAEVLIGHATSTASGISNANVTIQAASLDADTAATSTSFTIDANLAADIINNLSGGNVTLLALGANGTDGDLVVDGAIETASTNDLNLLSTQDVTFNASVQNGGLAVGGAAGDTGAVNVVAGLDPAAVADLASFDMAAVLADNTAFGNNMGSVFIGDGTQAAGIAVGSRFGATNVATYDLNAQAGAASGSYAQLGFNANDGNFATSIDTDGAITVAALNDVTFTTSDGTNAYVQLGHGALDAAGNHSGAITLLSARDVTFTAGNEFFAYAQLGHGGISAAGDHSGAITLDSARDVTFTAGNGFAAFFAYTQLGHGGISATGNHSGAVTLGSARDVTFTAGRGSAAYAQLGHGGISAAGDHSGVITLGSARDVTFIADSAYAQLGHGGFSSAGNHSGNVMIGSANDLSFSAGTASGSYAQLGHGGTFSGGNHSGDIQVVADGSISLAGGASSGEFTRIGHGDDFGDGDAGNTVSGDVIVLGRGGITLTTAEIGHQIDADGAYTGGDTLIGTEGDLVADAGSRFDSAPGGAGVGELRIYVSDAASDQVDGATLLNGVAHGAVTLPNNQGSFAFTGGPYVPNTSATGGAIVNGNFAYYALDGIFFNFEVDTVAEATAITDALASGDVTLAFDQGGFAFGAEFDGDGGTQFITIDEALVFNSPHDLNFITTGDISFNASVQNGDLVVGGAAGDTGAVNIVAGFDGSQPSSSFDFSDFSNAVTNTAFFGNNNGSVFIGDGTQAVGIAVGSRFGATNVAAYDLSAQAGAVANSFAQLGFNAFDGGFGTPGAATLIDTDGAITVAAQHDLDFQAGTNDDAYAQLGHGGINADGNHNGALTITQAGDLTFTAGAGDSAYAQLGHGGDNANGNLDGAITVTTATRLNFSAGDGNDAYAQLGHGGYNSIGESTGDIRIGTVTDAVQFDAAGGDTAYAQLGHGGYSSEGDDSGAITIESVGGDLSFLAGTENSANSQLGHGGYNANANYSGDITIGTVSGDIIFTAGSENATYAQIGHGGAFTAGDFSGAIQIQQANDLRFSGGAGFSFAQLGHGGTSADGNHSGDITLIEVSDLFFDGGSGSNSYAQLGHGGNRTDGNHSGNITIEQANDMSFTAGSGGNASAQLGHGGHDADGNYSGGIGVTLDGDLELTGVDTIDQYAIIGHGDQPGDGDLGDTVSGTVSVLVSGNATLSNAFMGHQIDADGTYTSGNTFVGVGGDLTADAASQFNSALGGAGMGELRVYLLGSDNVNAATLFNGTAHGAVPFPNNQGTFSFGEGPYAPVTGNFAYYGLIGTFSYIVDNAEAAAIVADLLAGGDVTLRSDLNQAAFGAFVDLTNPFIQIDADISYNSDNALNLIALGDITLNAQIENSSTTGGDINAAAGWDGTTTAIADILADPAAYGNNAGAIMIGDISTARGDINLYGFNISSSGATLETEENGRINIDALGNLLIDNNSVIETDRGRIRLTGNNTDADTRGDFSGV